MLTRSELEETGKQLNPEIRLFKSKNVENYSLTTNGFLLIKHNEIFPTIFEIPTTDFKTKDFMNTRLAIQTPYYVDNKDKKIYHFDLELEIIAALSGYQMSVYFGSFR